MNVTNIFAAIPLDLSSEAFDEIIGSQSVRIERIISTGQVSPAAGWYDQDEHEWVIVLKGAAIIEFDGGEACNLAAGDYLNIPAHTKHKVSWTDPEDATVWLAVFYR